MRRTGCFREVFASVPVEVRFQKRSLFLRKVLFVGVYRQLDFEVVRWINCCHSLRLTKRGAFPPLPTRFIPPEHAPNTAFYFREHGFFETRFARIPPFFQELHQPALESVLRIRRPRVVGANVLVQSRVEFF